MAHWASLVPNLLKRSLHPSPHMTGPARYPHGFLALAVFVPQPSPWRLRPGLVEGSHAIPPTSPSQARRWASLCGPSAVRPEPMGIYRFAWPWDTWRLMIGRGGLSLFDIAPRKPDPASVTGPNPGKIDDDTTNLVSALGKAVVPKPADNRTMVFAVFFEAGLRFPCNVLLPEILRLFYVELPQLSPSALVRIAIFDWACRTGRFEPSAELFGAIFYATVNLKTKKTAFGSVNFNVRPERSDLWPVNASMSKWDRHWMSKWFYHSIPFEARKPKVAGIMEARFSLLRKVCLRLSCRDLVEEFCVLQIFLLSQSLQIEVDRDEEADGLSKLVMPKGGAKMLTLVQAEAEARKVIGDVSITEYSQLLTRQAAGRANHMCDGDLPSRAKPSEVDGDEGTSKKRKRGQDSEEEGEDEVETDVAIEMAANELADNRIEMRGYTPTPSPDHVETGVESNSSPLGRKDLEGAKPLVSIAAAKVAKGGKVKKTSKKKGLVDVACVFSDDESSDETPTSPARRSHGLSTALGATADVGEARGSAAAGTSASADRVVNAAARLFGSPPRDPVASLPAIQKGKKAAIETSASEYSLAAPRFATGDLETQAGLIPFVEGILVAHCSTERTVRARFDGFKNHLRAKDDELGRKSLQMESLANTLKEAKAENRRLQAELEKGSEAKAEIERLKAELKKEQDQSAALTEGSKGWMEFDTGWSSSMRLPTEQ
uniref:OSJNBb0115I09.4 protein n=2 Tax=Oryza TaxID=4527 RepID=Q7XLA8_ORYSJ|nr:OSJNBb0115I09.4 [Oryza sativa Japonica Group]